MALFDKINLDKIGEIAKSVSDKTMEIAKTVGDKTSDMLEIGKLNTQISSANNSIEELKTRLGEHYWSLFSEGAQLDDDAVVLCGTIKEYLEEIDSLKAKVAELKAKATSAAICPSCGAENAEDALFCKKCGARLTAEEEEAENSCETQVECVIDALEEEIPQTKTCSNCGAENAFDNNYCEKCGSKL